MDLDFAKSLFLENFIGPEELRKISKNSGIKVPQLFPEIPFSKIQLESCQNDYLLILGSDKMNNDTKLSLNSLRKFYGMEPEQREPCFYNQDWYLNETFINQSLENKWYLVQKNIINNTRSQLPYNLTIEIKMPSAILCAYAFFSNWYCSGNYLWPNDYVWCDNLDNHGDRIYVGRYFDLSKNSKNGFSIHRHLSIKQNYGSINCFI
jgi:hypothetical protein